MATYITKYKELRLIVKPRRVERTNSGNNILPGKSIEFKKGLFTTENKDEIKFIENHARFGVSIFKQKTQEEMDDELIKKAEKVKENRVKKTTKNVKNIDDKIKNAKK